MSKTDWYNTIKRLPLIKKLRVSRQLYKCTHKYALSSRMVRYVEANPSQKEEIVKQQIEKWPQIANELKVKIETLAEEIDDKQKKEVITDMYFAYFAYGFTPNEYVCYGLYKKTSSECHEFISNRGSIYYGYKLNDIDSFDLFMNKNKTYELFKEYYKRDAISISSKADEDKFYDFIERHKVFVKKVVNESCGRSVELINLNTDKSEKKEMFYDLLSQGEIILEECVIQDKVMSDLNASSVNTVRCITLNTQKGIVNPYCFLKVGRKGAFVDNGGAGGILVGIDSESGILNTDGVDETNRRYAMHPDSKIVFKGYRLPEWDSLISICREMAGQVPKVKFIGWDMAYTTEGWIVIEGNAMSEVIGPQATSQKGMRYSLEKYMKDMK